MVTFKSHNINIHPGTLNALVQSAEWAYLCVFEKIPKVHMYVCLSHPALVAAHPFKVLATHITGTTARVPFMIVNNE